MYNRSAMIYDAIYRTLGIFTDDEYQQAFQHAGREVLHDLEGPDGRGLHIGIKPRM